MHAYTADTIIVCAQVAIVAFAGEIARTARNRGADTTAADAYIPGRTYITVGARTALIHSHGTVAIAFTSAGITDGIGAWVVVVGAGHACPSATRPAGTSLSDVAGISIVTGTRVIAKYASRGRITQVIGAAVTVQANKR
jgi:hypothetical protein